MSHSAGSFPVRRRPFLLPAAGILLLPGIASAAEAVPAVDTGNTAWMLTSTALVLFMMIPGLALF